MSVNTTYLNTHTVISNDVFKSHVQSSDYYTYEVVKTVGYCYENYCIKSWQIKMALFFFVL